MPPLPKTAPPTPENVQIVRTWLTSLIAGHTGARNTYTFYEEIDTWLGPFGASGYPLGYGKRYNVLFSSNERLQMDPVGREWVWHTTIILQEALRDFLVARFAAGGLGSLLEPELRRAAFDSHPRAYVRGGLTLVLLIAPELLPEIVAIPNSEFSPSSPNFGSSWRQVFTTMGQVVPSAAATLLSHLSPAMNARRFQPLSGYEQIARDHGFMRFADMTRQLIQRGEMDRIGLLQDLTNKIEVIQFHDQGMAHVISDLVAVANQRKRIVAQRYEREIQQDERRARIYDSWDRGWRRWLR